MQRKSARVIGQRSLEVGKVPAIVNSRSVKPFERTERVAHSVRDDFFSVQRSGGLEQEFHELALPLVVSPIADPEQVSLMLCLLRGKDVAVSGFVKRPDSWDTKPIGIDSSKRFSEGKYAIDSVQMKAKDLAGARVSAMMRIVKESAKS